MKPVDRYVEEVLRHVLASPDERERLETDLRAHFAEAESQDASPSRILSEMGSPEEVAAAFNAEQRLEHAGFWQRLVAFFADVGALIGLTLPALSLGVLMATRLFPDGEPPLEGILLLIVAGSAVIGIIVFYFPILEARFGKTLGKHLMRLRVVRETGAPIGLGQAFVRRLSMYFEMLVIDALFIPFTDKRQRALDVVAKTVVVREPGAKASLGAYLLCLVLPIVATAVAAGLLALCAPT